MDPIRRIIYIERDRDYNDCNVHTMAPFNLSGRTLLVELPQYEAWAKTDALDLLRAHFPDIQAVDPSSLSKLGAVLPDWYWLVYYTILGRSTPKHWYHLVSGAKIIDCNLNDKEGHLQVAQMIQDAMDEHPEHLECDGWFIKSGACSTKKDYKPVPVHSGTEAVEHLSGSQSVLRAFERGHTDCLLLRPWDNSISSNNEVRVFVRNGKVVGVSQQACYTPFVYMLNILKAVDVIDACQREYDRVQAGISKRHRMYYECTFDAYLIIDDKGDVSCHLIEINSEAFGWGPAGSSLFSWTDRPPPQTDEAPLYLVAGVL